MISLSTSGTLGDVFCLVTKLYKLAQVENLYLNHYTLHHAYRKGIKEIFSLLPNATVDFVPLRDTVSPRVHSHVRNRVDDIELDACPYPEFPELDQEALMIKNGEYVTVCPKSGRQDQDRRLPEDIIRKIGGKKVLLGSSPNSQLLNTTDLTGKTSLREAFNIIKHSKAFYGYQGVLSLAALSFQVPTTIYVKSKEEEGDIMSRIYPCWEKDLQEIVYV